MSGTTSEQSADQQKNAPSGIRLDEWLAEMERLYIEAKDQNDGCASLTELIDKDGGDSLSPGERVNMLRKIKRAIKAGKMECRKGKRMRIDNTLSPVPVYRWKS